MWGLLFSCLPVYRPSPRAGAVFFLTMVLTNKIGCEDCLSTWVGYCPLCKKKAKTLYCENNDRVPYSRLSSKDRKAAFAGGVTVYVEINNSPPPRPKARIKKGYTKTKKRLLQKHPKDVVKLILSGHAPKCICCGSNERLSYDHIVPASKGGTRSIKNGQILCERCNLLKGNKEITISQLKNLLLK